MESRFYTFFDNELLSKLHQQFKNFPKLILITFFAKKTRSYRNGNQKCNGVCSHHTPLGYIGLKHAAGGKSSGKICILQYDLRVL